ncbi:hypothetical protein [Chryseobacterium gregarium]|uniref:hypothetical protein n=1 Tax=Chryseobacterium gregarium TaxID=456299 RepID=UPI0003F74130|nr:hypothetical protein [Chryseobacterium gregarium]
MNTNNPTVQITNNSTIPVDIYDVFNPGTTGQTVPYTYTKLDTIPAGSTKTIQTIRTASQLQAMYTGTIEKLSSLYFYQFPIKVMAAVQFSFDNPPPLVFTITADDQNSMIQSFLFHRYAMANPNSALTKNLYAALKGGSTASVNSFFASTQNFKACTLSSWNAVMSWLQMFTSGWQGPFYLYEQAPNPAPSGYVPVLVGTMNIISTASENSATLKLCTQDASGNPVYTDNTQPTSIIMNGDGTMGDSNPGGDVSVSLTPVWMNVIQTSMKDGQPVSTYLAGPTLTGTIANKTVVSSQTARQIPGKPADKNKQSSFDSTFGKICQGVGLLVGLLMLGEFGKKMFDGAKEKLASAKEKATSEKEYENEDNEIENTPDPDIVSEVSAEQPSFESSASSVTDSYSEISESMQKDVMTQTMEDTMFDINNEISEQLENGLTPTQEYESAVSDLQTSFKDAGTQLEEGNFSDASKELSSASSNMEETIQKGESSLQEWESQSLQESADAVNEASEASDALDTAQEDYENDMNDEENDSGYDADEDSEWPEAEEMAEL